MSALKIPAAEYLPPNVSLETMDVFGDVPENLVGTFDVLHIHTFCVVVKNGNPVLLLQHLIRILSEFTYMQAQPRNLLAFHWANTSSASKNRADTFKGTRCTVRPSVRIPQTGTLEKRTRTNYYACGSNLPPILIWSSSMRRLFSRGLDLC